jgi:hypothetical protein
MRIFGENGRNLETGWDFEMVGILPKLDGRELLTHFSIIVFLNSYDCLQRPPEFSAVISQAFHCGLGISEFAKGELIQQ